MIKEIRKPHTIVSDGPPLYNTGHFELYGLGFFLQDYQGRKIVSHTGGVNGFVSSVTLVPEEKLGIIVLTNTDHNALYEALKWEILDAYLGLPYRNYSNVYLGMVKAQNLAGQKSDKMLMDSAALGLAPGLPLQAYTGDFVNEVYGKMSVALEGGELRMHFSHHPGMYGGLQSLGNHRFYVRFSDPEFGKAVFPFTVEKGKVKSVRVKVADFIEYDPYVFVKTSP